jgi:2-oxoglutarate ferredoxin oxidoreductase subunit beta
MQEEKVKGDVMFPDPSCAAILEDEFDLIYEKPHTMTETRMHYCPGCGHSTVHKLLAEVIEELGIQEQTVGVAPVGCAVFAYDYLNIDMQEAAHGRACAVATGVKRMLPDKYVFTYQGDGDLAAIGTAETIHAINRGENFVIIFINNGVYGMTSGQMAPTTPIGFKTTTSPYGRKQETMGAPIKVSELVAPLPGAFYITRQAVYSAATVRKTKKAIMNAFKYQKLGKGTSVIEILSNCPSNWKMTPLQTNDYIEKEMTKVFPLGDVKLPSKEDLKLLEEIEKGAK